MKSNLNTLVILGLFVIISLILFYYFGVVNKQVDNFDNDKDKKYNLAFYTCFYGSDDNLSFKIPELPSNKYDCYYFSNNMNLLKKLKNTKWLAIYDNKPVSTDIIESCMLSKHVKVSPELFPFLKDYDYTCFLDSKLDWVSEKFVEKFIKKYFIDQNYALLIREHETIKDSVWNEYSASMSQTRYVLQKDQYMSYIYKQIKKGLSENTERHCQCGFLIRNMNHPIIPELDNTWQSHIEECGIQDQISFFFVKQLFKEHIHIFKESPFIKRQIQLIPNKKQQNNSLNSSDVV